MAESRRWDECCPHCDEKITQLDDYFSCHDYATDFTMECPHCGAAIDVIVEPVPEFGLCKAATAAAQEPHP